MFWATHMWRHRVDRPKLLVLDSHGAQLTTRATAVLTEQCNTTTVTVPGGCTPLVQPLDVCVNAPFKRRVDDLFNKHLAANLDVYTNGTIPAGKRRILMTKWV